MSDPTNTPPEVTPPGKAAPEGDRSWRDLRRDEKRQRHQMRNGAGGPIIGGLVLVLLGAVFLARNLGVFVFENWWAVFLLIPAFGAFGASWSAYKRDGRMSSGVVSSAFAGLIFVGLCVAFLLGLNWGIFWPVILILIGLAVLSGRYWMR